MRMSKFMRISADADPDAELRYTSNIYIVSFDFIGGSETEKVPHSATYYIQK